MQQVMRTIVRKPLKVPQWLSEDSSDLLQRLLRKKPNERIGSSNRGFADIKEHPFFSDLVWSEIAARAVPAPFVPIIPPETDANEEVVEDLELVGSDAAA